MSDVYIEATGTLTWSGSARFGNVYLAADGSLAWSGTAALIAGVAPSAPILVSPPNGQTIDLTTPTFTWSFYSPVGATQATYSLRRMQSGTSTWQYWTGSAWSSVQVYVTSTSQSVTFGSGKWANGNVYLWEVGVQDSNGIASPFSNPSSVLGQPAPTATITGPVGTVVSGNVLVTWVNNLTTAQSTWQLIVYTAAQYGAGGWVAGGSPSYYNTGVVNGGATGLTFEGTAPGTYYAVVQLSNQYGTLGPWSAAFEIVVAYTTPQTPTLTASYDATTNNVTLTVTGHDTGPLVGNTTATVYRYTSFNTTLVQPVQTFTNIALPSSGQDATEIDYAPVPPQVEGDVPTISYYAIVTYTTDGTVSAPSTVEDVTPDLASGALWLFTNLDSGVTYSINIVANTQSQNWRGTLHEIIGVAQPVYLTDVVTARTFKVAAISITQDDWTNLQLVLTASVASPVPASFATAVTYYISNPYGLTMYCVVNPDPYQAQQTVGANVYRKVPFTLVEVAEPTNP
jgi:hypothetical protein